MLHRRTLFDDSLGVGEPLNETAFGAGLVVRGRHLLIVEAPSASAAIHRVSAQRLFMQPVATFALTPLPYVNYSAAYRQTWSALNESLPLNVHLLTFEQLTPKVFLIRLEHFFELFEDDILSQPVRFDLQSLFKQEGVISDIIELTLAGNLPKSDLQRLNWLTAGSESSHVGNTC
jgi:lysosomal alpha-mannosidase